MLSREKIEAMKKIKEEYDDLSSNPITNIGVNVRIPDRNNIFEWIVTMFAPSDTPYKGGLFYLKIKYPNDYPHSRPEVRFITPIYHLNVKDTVSSGPGDEELGHVCLILYNNLFS